MKLETEPFPRYRSAAFCTVIAVTAAVHTAGELQVEPFDLRNLCSPPDQPISETLHAVDLRLTRQQPFSLPHDVVALSYEWG